VGDSIYNSLVVFDGPNVRRYRKIHLFSPTEENKVFEPGSEFLVTEYQGTKIGFMTCYDLRFPEMARSLALMGASIIVVIAAFPLPRIHHWHTLLQARAIENQCVMVAVNRVGTDEGITFGGSSCVIHPTGTWIDRANPSDEELIVQELRIDLSQARSSIPVFVDRRPDLYNLLTSI
jgi:predicted amidohydrolase